MDSRVRISHIVKQMFFAIVIGWRDLKLEIYWILDRKSNINFCEVAL
jgi:hypothetical protein